MTSELFGKKCAWNTKPKEPLHLTVCSDHKNMKKKGKKKKLKADNTNFSQNYFKSQLKALFWIYYPAMNYPNKENFLEVCHLELASQITFFLCANDIYTLVIYLFRNRSIFNDKCLGQRFCVGISKGTGKEREYYKLL